MDCQFIFMALGEIQPIAWPSCFIVAFASIWKDDVEFLLPMPSGNENPQRFLRSTMWSHFYC